MIDLDHMDAQLERALAGGRPATAVEPDTPASPGPGGAVAELVELGRLDQADIEIAACSGSAGDVVTRRDVLTWSTMRALLDGRRSDVAAGLAAMHGLATDSGDAVAWDRYWTQRWWAAVQWGDEAERYDVVDHCRERAYRFGDISWWGALCLGLADLGKADEAARAFDEAYSLLGGPLPGSRRLADSAPTGARLDAVTNLVEGAALLGDGPRTLLAARCVEWPKGRLVVVGPAILCKGSVDRYCGLVLAAAGRWVEAGECFRSAAEVHRAIGAGVLLDRTHRQAERARCAA